MKLRKHLALVRECDQALVAANDRRLTEVNIEREKALKIKEQADRDALDLARDIQIYKDEKANELRSQIERERGSYATHAALTALSKEIDAKLSPLTAWVQSQQGKNSGVAASWAFLTAA
ncbi:MAG TPA: hypothetical protein VNH18_26435, partial [Bryobacteraceae bacterium]|nr:hypothetical protein [Bryobacteraceae bacterium]